MLKKLTDDVFVAGQIDPADVSEIADHGFKSIVCNRPDGEASDQPTFAEIAEVASAAGIVVRYVPVTPGRLTEADVEDFAAALSDLPKPVVAYCLSGTRSAMLWARTEARTRSVEDIAAITRRAGFKFA